MEKVIEIDGKNVGFRATALTPRLYRHKIGRDIVQDMSQLKKAYLKAASISDDATEEEKKDAQLSVLNLEIFENVAYIMARQYDNTIPDTPDEWLDQFAMFMIFDILPHILELWDLNQKTTSIPKKK